MDYKLCALNLAGRLLKVLQLVIHSDQTCSVQGHYIGEHLTLLRDVVHYVNENNLPAAVLALDQEKAFDRVDWDFLLTTLDHMGSLDHIRSHHTTLDHIRSNALWSLYQRFTIYSKTLPSQELCG